MKNLIYVFAGFGIMGIFLLGAVLSQIAYIITDTIIEGKQAKSIQFPNLITPIAIKTGDITFLKKSHIGNGNIRLMIYQDILKTRIKDSYECNCIVSKDNQTNEKITICETCYNYEDYYIKKLVELPDSFILDKDTVIYEVFGGCNKIERDNNGWGCSINTDIDILGIDIIGASWFNESFLRCENISINNSEAETLTNFVAYINLTKDNDMNSDFSDIRIVDKGCNMGGNVAPFMIESYYNNYAHVWALISSLSNSGVNYSVYYKNDTVIFPVENGTGVFPASKYVGAWLIGTEGGTGNIIEDSGANSLDLSVVTQGWNTSGKIGYCLYVNEDEAKAGQHNKNSAFELPYTTNWTISVWIKPDTITPTNEDTVWEYNDAIEANYIKGRFGSNKMYFLWNDGTAQYFAENTALPNTKWRFYSFRYAYNKIEMFVNGVKQAGSDTIDGNYYSASGEIFYIGNDYYADHGTSNRAFDGCIDSFVWQKKALTTDEVNMTYGIVNNQKELVYFGLEENYTYVPPVPPAPVYDGFAGILIADPDIYNLMAVGCSWESDYWCNNGVMRGYNTTTEEILCCLLVGVK